MGLSRCYWPTAPPIQKGSRLSSLACTCHNPREASLQVYDFGCCTLRSNCLSCCCWQLECCTQFDVMSTLISVQGVSLSNHQGVFAFSVECSAQCAFAANALSMPASHAVSCVHAALYFTPSLHSLSAGNAGSFGSELMQRLMDSAPDSLLVSLSYNRICNFSKQCVQVLP